MIAALADNCKKIIRIYQNSINNNCHFCLLPELFLCGYTPLDLLYRNSFLEEIMDMVNEIVIKTKDTVLLLPTPWVEDGKLYNAVIAIQNGNIIGKTYKHDLPNYGVFDEKRYFTSGTPNMIEAHGYKIGIPICEDIWQQEVCQQLLNQGVQILLVPNASPYEVGKQHRRLQIVDSIWKETKLPIIYCNQVLAHDGIVYDGGSFGYDGELKFKMPSFNEHSQVIEIIGNSIIRADICSADENELIYGAMVLGLQDYVLHNGFSRVLIGLSGGVDSALVTAIAADSLGIENVIVALLPSKHTSKRSHDDVALLLKNFPNIACKQIDISHILEVAMQSMPNLSQLAYENLQARIRGMILMSIANTENCLLLTTGNKSEIATGYCTIYGDMSGAFNPIKDLYKTQVWDICKWRNSSIPSAVKICNQFKPVIPESIITRPPTAELRDNQKDTDSLPEYQILDQILYRYIEENQGIKEIIRDGFDHELVAKTINLIKISEHKRWQAAPGVKINKNSFGKERRYPITNMYNG